MLVYGRIVSGPSGHIEQQRRKPIPPFEQQPALSNIALGW
jgi:hypothetical protein